MCEFKYKFTYKMLRRKPQADVTLVATWLTTSAGADVKKVTLSKNFLFGSKLKYGYSGETIHDIDAD